MKRLFCACVGLSIGLHVAAVLGWQPHPPAATAAGMAATRLPPSLVVLPRPGPAPARRADADNPSVPTLLPRLASPWLSPAEPASPANGPAAASDAADIPVDTRTAPRTGTTEPAEISAAAPINSDPAGWDDYVPRPLLTVGPIPHEDILLDYPADGPAVGRFVVTLTLYIDETGLVRRVDVAADEHLPGALHGAARASFTGKRFSPGELAGAAVKSRIRIEALFESLALPSLAARAAPATHLQ